MPFLDYYAPQNPNSFYPCSSCFPSFAETIASQIVPPEKRYVNLLDFPKFGGVSGFSRLPGTDSVGIHSYPNTELMAFPWFADIRYSWNTPLQHSYPSVHQHVLESSRVLETIERVSNSELRKLSDVKKQAWNYLYNMKASLSRFICRICGYVLFKVFRRVAKRLLVCPDQLKAVKEAEMSGVPIVYLPLHRSHLDYLLITWSVWHFGIRLPHIASGDNLNLSGFGWLLRGTGAFFIRRRLSPDDESSQDQLYRSVLNQYMIELLKSGMSVEFFLEGTRSRFGKTLLPKNGLISNIVDAVESSVIPDAWLVPVSFSYDNVVEGIFYDELLGIRKPKESVIGVIKGLYKSFNDQGKCGTAAINFGAPVRLTAYLQSLKISLDKNYDQFNLKYAPNPYSYRELLPWHDVRTPNRTLIRAIGYHLVSDAQENRPISVTSIAALLIGGKYMDRKSVKLDVFGEELYRLVEEVKGLGFEVIGATYEAEIEHSKTERTRNLVKEALYYLNNEFDYDKNNAERSILTIRKINDDYVIDLSSKLMISSEALMELCYRKNSALVPYLLHSLISIVILSTVTVIENKPVVEDLVDNALQLCDLLQCEFIFCKPCENLESLISNLSQDILKLMYEESNMIVEQIAKPLLAFELTFYANILKPFLLSLLIVTDYFLHNSVEEKYRDMDFIRKFLSDQVNKARYMDAEAMNSDSIYNSIKLLRIKGILSMEGFRLINEEQAKKIVDLIVGKFKIHSEFVRIQL